MDLLPASFGDCILVEYGDAGDPSRLLIDAGLKATYANHLRPRLASIAGGKAVPLELLVVTHIDRDHIAGILPLLAAEPCLVEPADVWFNGRQHLDMDIMGAADGEALGKLLKEQELPWNLAFDGRPVGVPEAGDLPRCTLPGGAVLTLLSPYQENLVKLAKNWDDSLGGWDEEPPQGKPVTADDILGKRPPLKAVDPNLVRELASSEFDEDHSPPNGSSIAFLFEFDGARILFGADAFPSILVRSLKRLSAGPIVLDAFKLAHHGSRANLSPGLLEKVYALAEPRSLRFSVPARPVLS